LQLVQVQQDLSAYEHTKPFSEEEPVIKTRQVPFAGKLSSNKVVPMKTIVVDNFKATSAQQ